MSSNTCSRSALRPVQAATTASADFPLAAHRRRPSRHEAGSPWVRTPSFTARPPDLRRLALVTRASRFHARSPCSAAPSIRFLCIGPRFTLHASSPRSVALTQLRFASLAMTSSWRDLHPQECARAGRTRKSPQACDLRALDCGSPNRAELGTGLSRLPHGPEYSRARVRDAQQAQATGSVVRAKRLGCLRPGRKMANRPTSSGSDVRPETAAALRSSSSAIPCRWI